MGFCRGNEGLFRVLSGFSPVYIQGFAGFYAGLTGFFESRARVSSRI